MDRSLAIFVFVYASGGLLGRSNGASGALSSSLPPPPQPSLLFVLVVVHDADSIACCAITSPESPLK